METFELNYSLEELKKRTDKEYLITKKFLDVDAPEYLALAEGDKKALKNLVKAAFFIQKINYQLDNKKILLFMSIYVKKFSKAMNVLNLQKFFLMLSMECVQLTENLRK